MSPQVFESRCVASTKVRSDISHGDEADEAGTAGHLAATELNLYSNCLIFISLICYRHQEQHLSRASHIKQRELQLESGRCKGLFQCERLSESAFTQQQVCPETVLNKITVVTTMILAPKISKMHLLWFLFIPFDAVDQGSSTSSTRLLIHSSFLPDQLDTCFHLVSGSLPGGT